MLASSSVVRTDELSHQQFVAQAQHERQIDSALAPPRATSLGAAAPMRRPGSTLMRSLWTLVSLFSHHGTQAAADLGW